MKIYCPDCGNCIADVSKKVRKNTKYFCNNCLRFFEPNVLPGIPAFSEPSEIRARRDLYVCTACDELNLTDDIRREIIDLLNKYSVYQTRGEVAGAIYIILGKHDIEMTQKKISDALNVSDVTLRMNRNKFLERMK